MNAAASLPGSSGVVRASPAVDGVELADVAPVQAPKEGAEGGRGADSRRRRCPSRRGAAGPCPRWSPRRRPYQRSGSRPWPPRPRRPRRPTRTGGAGPAFRAGRGADSPAQAPPRVPAGHRASTAPGGTQSCTAGKPASKTGSNTTLTADCTMQSRTAGIDSGPISAEPGWVSAPAGQAQDVPPVARRTARREAAQCRTPRPRPG